MAAKNLSKDKKGLPKHEANSNKSHSGTDKRDKLPNETHSRAAEIKEPNRGRTKRV